MSDLYLACDWIIRPGVNYLRLAEAAAECGCALSLAEATAVTPEKFVVMRFALRAPSQAAFDDFLSKVGQSIGLTDWQPCAELYFAKAQPMDFGGVDANFLQQWMAAMHAYGLHNESLRQQGGD
jgi:hypothetical protein